MQLNLNKKYPLTISGVVVVESSFMPKGEMLFDPINGRIYTQEIYKLLFAIEKNFSKALQMCVEHAKNKIDILAEKLKNKENAQNGH